MNRRELLFIYDASYCNPNGDPADENKPRTDPETQVNLVSDVRLKRTIRDYLDEVKGKTIFVRAIPDEEGGLPDGKARARDFIKPEIQEDETFGQVVSRLDKQIYGECIDVRLFGATIPLDLKIYNKKKKKESKTGSIIHTGPVQFKLGKSLHKVSVERIKGTGAFASKEGASQNTFRTEYLVPYSLISFHGIVNEYRAEEVELTEEDLDLLYEAMWEGTKYLITRSKIGQTPRLLLSIVYNEGNFQLSDLDNKVKIESDISDLALRSIDDYVLSLDKLIDSLNKHKSKIKNIQFAVDDFFRTSYKGEVATGDEIKGLLEKIGVPVEQILE